MSNFNSGVRRNWWRHYTVERCVELLTGSVLLYLALGFAVWLETRRILRNRLKEILG